MGNIERWTLLPPYTEAGDDPDGNDDVVILRGFEGPKVKERIEVVSLHQLEGAVDLLGEARDYVSAAPPSEAVRDLLLRIDAARHQSGGR